MMSGTSGHNKKSSAQYNDAFEMLPESGKFFGAVNRMSSGINKTDVSKANSAIAEEREEGNGEAAREKGEQEA